MSLPDTVIAVILGAILLLNAVMLVLLFRTIKDKGKEKPEDFGNLIENALYKNQLDLMQKTNDHIREQLEKTRAVIDQRFEVLSEKNAQTLSNATKELYEIQNKFSQVEVQLLKTVSDELAKINASVETRLATGFEQTRTTFTNVMERLAVIDQAQTNIEALSKDIIQLQDILQDKTKRGNFGEFQLNAILENVFGVSGDIYQTQYKMSNDTRVDAIIFTPENKGHIAIDSKFPLENYRKMIVPGIPEAEKKNYETAFKADVKKHIDDISRKYIIPGETIGYALMFIPSEAIYYYILAIQQELVGYAEKKHVALTSPTTLIATLKVIQISLLDYKRRQNTNLIIEELRKLSKEFERYNDRWTLVRKAIEKAKDESDKLSTTNEKIIKQFEQIGKMDEETLLEEKVSSE